MTLEVFTYWSGPRPPWIDLCLDTMRRRCVRSTFHFLTPENVDEVIDPAALPERWRDLPPGIGTDCLRAALLTKRGGLWIDADTVLLRDPAELLECHDPAQFIYSTWPTPPDRVVAGYAYAPAGNRIACRWLEGAISALRWAENIGWTEIGEGMLTPIVRMSPSSAWEMPRHRFLPIDISSEPEVLLSVSDWRSFSTDETIGFALNHSWLEAQHQDAMHVPLSEMATSDILVHRLLADNATRGVQSKPAKSMTLDLSTTPGGTGREDCQDGWQNLAAKWVGGMHVLDVGAGLCLGTVRLLRCGGFVVTQDVGPDLPVDCRDPVSTFPSGSYDAVTAFDVIEHVPDDVDFLDDLLRIARQVVIVTTPNESVSHAANGAHCREYTPEDFVHLVERWAPRWRAEWWIGDGPGRSVRSVDRFEFVGHGEPHQGVALRRVG